MGFEIGAAVETKNVSDFNPFGTALISRQVRGALDCSFPMTFRSLSSLKGD